MDSSVGIRHYKAITGDLDDVSQNWNGAEQRLALGGEVLQVVPNS